MTKVYSKPSCVQCTATKKALVKLGIEHEVVDVSVDDEARQELQELGYLQVPVVVLDSGESWSGYRPEKIKNIESLVTI